MSDLVAPNGRSFNCARPYSELKEFFQGAFKLHYRGVKMVKNPFDVAIYMQLISKGRPRTVIEIGSHRGGSALFFADMIRMKGEDTRVISVDVVKPPIARDPRVTFLEGDATRLGDVLTDELLASLPRPWLVSEDSAHAYATSKAALDFFRDRLEVGEYIVIEDGGFSDMEAEYPDGGPNRAVNEFLHETDGCYEPDPDLCDMFGYNVTGHPNGYLRRVK